MEENLPGNIPFSSPDHDGVMAGFCCGRSELTRMNLDSSSVSVDSFKDFDVNTRPGLSTAWTNEKHSLYLGSLEAAFVKQLHHSIGLRSCLQEQSGAPHSSLKRPARGHNSLHQHMVMQDGWWQNANYKRNEPLSESTVDSHSIQRVPRKHRFTSSSEHHTAVSHDFLKYGASCRGITTHTCVSVRSLEKYPACCLTNQDSVDSTIEVSDQNFVDEDHGQKSSCVQMSKRFKIRADVSIDQKVLPFKKSRRRDVSTTNESFYGREDYINQELP